MIHPKEQIIEAIKAIPELTDEELIHNFKCASSTKHIAYKIYMESIHKELRKRRKERGEDEETEHYLMF